MTGGKCLGNVRIELIKRTAKELVRRFPNRFSNSFEENKKLVNSLVDGGSVKVRNKIAGYITRFLAVREVESPHENFEEVKEN
jgi:small subunit ribosomal protein S17e